MSKAVAILVAVGVFLVSFVGVAVADHYDYLAADPLRQNFSEPGTENEVFLWWGYTTAPLEWWAESALLSDVTAAKNNWTAVVPELAWLQVSSDVDADMSFYHQACPNSPPEVLGCFSEVNFFNDTGRQASTWTRAVVWIRPENYGTGGRTAVIAHEIGHGYGLHEKYLGDPVGPERGPEACNAGVISIMDMFTTNGSGQLVHCDGLTGPEPADDTRVTAYWSKGEMSSFAATPNGSIGTYTWHDDAWAEERHQLQWYYWDGSDWILYHSKIVTAKTGVHRITEDRTLTEVVDRTTYGAPAGEHIACGAPWFIKWGVAGTSRCSNQITLQ